MVFFCRFNCRGVRGGGKFSFLPSVTALQSPEHVFFDKKMSDEKNFKADLAFSQTIIV